MKLRWDDIDNNFSTTLSSAITAASTSIPLEAVPSNATEGFLVIDEETDAKREFIYFSSVGATSVVCPATDGRGQCGSSATSHDSGVSVKMVQLREHFKPFRDAIVTGWAELNYTATYASASSITIPTDLTTLFTEGRRIKLNFASTGIVYCTISSSTYGAPNTTIVLSGGTVANEVISNIYTDLSPTGSTADVMRASSVHAATSKTTPVDADELPLVDSAASFGLKKLTWANLKATLASAFLAVTGGTLTGDIQLGETDIKLDAVLSADEKWSGIVIAGVSGVTTLAVGDLCYLNADDSRWELVDANLSDGYDKQLGICVLAGADGAATEMLVYGKVRSAAFPAFTVGSPLYISETAGDMTHTAPVTADSATRIVGIALTAEDLLFNPSNDYYTHT
jgi:hypothetical protein